MIVPIVWTFFETTGTIRTIRTIIWKPGLRPNYQLWEHCITKRKKKKIKFVMHRVKIFVSSSLFSFYQGMVRTMKMSFFRKKNILSRYTQILVEFPRLMASSSEWTRLKPLLRESSLLTSGFARIIVYKLIVPWPGSAVGKKWENMEWKGIKRSRGPFSLVPRLPLNSLGSPMFFFFSPLNFPLTAEPGPMLNWLLWKIVFFLNGYAPI